MTWSSVGELRERLRVLLARRHPGMVTRLDVELRGDTVVLVGEVASEACRSAGKRLALSFDGILKVRNELVVAAFLQSAGTARDEDAYFDRGPERTGRQEQALGYDKGGSPNLRTDRTAAVRRPARRPAERTARRPSVRRAAPADVDGAPIEVRRLPAITASEEPRPDAWIEVEVALVEGGTGAATISLGTHPATWTELEVRVRLIAPWATDVEEVLPVVVVRRDGSCVPARFRCRVADDYAPGSAAEVHAVFVHGTRVCGHVVDDIAMRAPSPAPASGVVDLRSFRLATDEAGPSLSVSIARSGENRQTWVWSAMLPGAVMDGSGVVELDPSAEAFAADLLRACPTMTADRHRRVFAGLGEKLWQAAPSGFRSIYERCSEVLGPGYPIQFVTDDPHVPWEMMRPDDGVGDHLFIRHPVARWPLTRSGRRHGRLGRGDVLSFVPRYGGGSELPWAVREGEWMREAMGAIAMTPTVDTFLGVLDGRHEGTVGVLHFAGHGQVDTGVSDGGIELEDGMVGVLEVDQSRVVLGARDRTLVFLNACETSSGARLLGMNVGWGAAIASREFGGLVAPLWEVDDESAFDMVRQVMPLIEGGATLGEAVARSRAALCDRSPSAFAYLAFGDVMASSRTTP
jgi:hypothetical protein